MMIPNRLAETNPSFKIVSRDNREDTGHDSFTDREYMQETHNYLKINFDVMTNSKDSEPQNLPSHWPLLWSTHCYSSLQTCHLHKREQRPSRVGEHISEEKRRAINVKKKEKRSEQKSADLRVAFNGAILGLT